MRITRIDNSANQRGQTSSERKERECTSVPFFLWMPSVPKGSGLPVFVSCMAMRGRSGSERGTNKIQNKSKRNSQRKVISSVWKLKENKIKKTSSRKDCGDKNEEWLEGHTTMRTSASRISDAPCGHALGTYSLNGSTWRPWG